MAMNAPAWILSQAFTKETADEFGAVKGAPCTVGNVSYDADGNTVVELVWTNSAGASRTTNVTIKAGLSTKAVSINDENHLIIILSDDSEIDAGVMPSLEVQISEDEGNIIEEKEDGLYVAASGVQISAKADNIIKSEPDGLYATADEIAISEKTGNVISEEADGLYVPSGLEIDDDATNARNKTWSAKKINDSIKVNTDAIEVLNGDTDVDGSVAKQITDAIAKLNKLEKKIVDVLPSVEDADANTIYLIKQGDTTTYDMYTLVTLADGSKSLASMGGTEIDLDGYVKEEELDDYVSKTDINTITGETDPTVPSLEFMKTNTYSLGIPEVDLAEGQDLDDLTTRNKKYKTTGAVAATLLNCPVTTTGFRLTVYSMSVTSYVTQLLETADDKYIRYWNKSKSKWYAWKKIATSEDLANYMAKNNVVAAFSETISDEKVPSEKLVKDSLDTKVDAAIVTGYINLDVGADLNTLVEYGTYRTTTKRVDRIENIPVQIAGMLEVRLTGSIIYQTYKTIGDDVYIRSSEDAGVTWSDWKNLSGGDTNVIDDDSISENSTWSSKKINDSLVDIDADNVNITKEDDTKKSLQAMYEDGELGGGGAEVYITENKATVTVGTSWTKLVQTNAKKSGNCIIGIEMLVPNGTRTQYFQVLVGTKTYSLVLNTQSGYGNNLASTVIVPNVKEGDNIQLTCAITSGSMAVTYSSITELYV